MVICGPGQEQQIIAILDTSVGLTEEQRTALAAEITDDPEERGYAAPIAAQNWVQVRLLLLGHYTIEQAEQYVPKPIVTGQEIKNWIAPLRMRVRMSTASDALKAAWLDIMGDWSVIADAYTFEPASSATWQSLVSQVVSLVDAGGQRLITDADLLALTSTYVPATMATANPRSWSVLGIGRVVEIADLVALHTEGLI